MNAIAGNIALKRKALGLTQKELAEKLHVSDKTVSRWETGETIPGIPLCDVGGTLVLCK